MMGVEMDFEALMISLMRGTPSVMFIDATPAKWNVFSVICVHGSPASRVTISQQMSKKKNADLT